jgi:hypothetical protein
MKFKFEDFASPKEAQVGFILNMDGSSDHGWSEELDLSKIGENEELFSRQVVHSLNDYCVIQFKRSNDNKDNKIEI